MARAVKDLALVLPVISGTDPRDRFTFPLPLHDYRRVDFRRLRVAFFTNSEAYIKLKKTWVSNPTKETQEAIRTAAKALASKGAQVDEARYKHCAEQIELETSVIAEGAFADGMADLEREYGHDKGIAGLVAVVNEWTAAHSKQEIQSLRERLPSLYRSVLEFFEKYDVLICPVTDSPAPPHGEMLSYDVLKGQFYTPVFSSLGPVPSGTVRCSTSPERLPIGIQVVAKGGRDDYVLAVMDHLEKEFGGWKPSPIL
jgi:amidase